eukprot:jgi/Botrbrau1/21978/Bobra.0577s0001.1
MGAQCGFDSSRSVVLSMHVRQKDSLACLQGREFLLVCTLWSALCTFHFSWSGERVV